MKTIRSFIAIPLDPEISRDAGRLIQRLRDPEDRIKWVPADNLHLTLKFLGDVDNVEVPEVCSVVRDICQDYPPFELSFAGVGGFPDLDRARVLYVGVDDPTDSLREIVERLEEQLAKLGFKREPRDYTPHLTLGRTRSGSRRADPDVIERLRAEADLDLGTMRADTVHLMASFLDKHGPTYQTMDTIDL